MLTYGSTRIIPIHVKLLVYGQHARSGSALANIYSESLESASSWLWYCPQGDLPASSTYA